MTKSKKIDASTKKIKLKKIIDETKLKKIKSIDETKSKKIDKIKSKKIDEKIDKKIDKIKTKKIDKKIDEIKSIKINKKIDEIKSIKIDEKINDIEPTKLDVNKSKKIKDIINLDYLHKFGYDIYNNDISRQESLGRSVIIYGVSELLKKLDSLATKEPNMSNKFNDDKKWVLQNFKKIKK